jgi:hypothetical protein
MCPIVVYPFVLMFLWCPSHPSLVWVSTQSFRFTTVCVTVIMTSLRWSQWYGNLLWSKSITISHSTTQYHTVPHRTTQDHTGPRSTEHQVRWNEYEIASKGCNQPMPAFDACMDVRVDTCSVWLWCEFQVIINSKHGCIRSLLTLFVLFFSDSHCLDLE